MKSESNDASLKIAADFLLAEYHTMENHLWKNEELGDRRVNIFLTVASAVMAASASLMAGEDFFTVTGTLNPKLFWIIFFSLTAVFLFGLLTLSRIIRRNLETDSCKMALDRIRLYFLRLNPNIFPYLPFDPHKKIPQRRAHLLAFGSGGLVQTIVFINCLLLAAAGGLIAIAGSAFVAVHAGAPAARIQGSWLLYSTGLIAGIVAALGGWLLQLTYVNNQYKTRKDEMEMPLPDKLSREVESKFIVTGENPEQTGERLAEIPAIMSFPLMDSVNLRIHDTYFDTSKKDLKAHHLSLRIREIDDSTLITLKGRQAKTEWGGTSRMEIEQEWSETAITEVWQELEKDQVSINHPAAISMENPVKALQIAGLEIVQDRQTLRQVRNIVDSEGQGSEILAELAFDKVEYRVGGKKVVHYEVELEAKSEKGVALQRDMVRFLSNEFADQLRPWKYSKLATGGALEAMQKDAILDGYLDNLNRLLPAGYDRIAAYLDKKS